MYLLIAYTLASAAWAIASSFGAPHRLPVYVGGYYLGDKILHFAIAGTFAVAIAQALWRAGCRPERSLLYGAGLAMLLVSLEEATNALTPHRHCSLLDLVADLSGVFVLTAGAWVSGIRTRRFGWKSRPFVRPHGYVPQPGAPLG